VKYKETFKLVPYTSLIIPVACGGLKPYLLWVYLGQGKGEPAKFGCGFYAPQKTRMATIYEITSSYKSSEGIKMVRVKNDKKTEEWRD